MLNEKVSFCDYNDCNKKGVKPLLMQKKVYKLYCVKHGKFIRGIFNHGKAYGKFTRTLKNCVHCNKRAGKYHISLKRLVCGLCFNKYYNNEVVSVGY